MSSRSATVTQPWEDRPLRGVTQSAEGAAEGDESPNSLFINTSVLNLIHEWKLFGPLSTILKAELQS